MQLRRPGATVTGDVRGSARQRPRTGSRSPPRGSANTSLRRLRLHERPDRAAPRPSRRPASRLVRRARRSRTTRSRCSRRARRSRVGRRRSPRINAATRPQVHHHGDVRGVCPATPGTGSRSPPPAPPTPASSPFVLHERPDQRHRDLHRRRPRLVRRAGVLERHVHAARGEPAVHGRRLAPISTDQSSYALGATVTVTYAGSARQRQGLDRDRRRRLRQHQLRRLGLLERPDQRHRDLHGPGRRLVRRAGVLDDTFTLLAESAALPRVDRRRSPRISTAYAPGATVTVTYAGLAGQRQGLDRDRRRRLSPTPATSPAFTRTARPAAPPTFAARRRGFTSRAPSPTTPSTWPRSRRCSRCAATWGTHSASSPP